MRRREYTLGQEKDDWGPRLGREGATLKIQGSKSNAGQSRTSNLTPTASGSQESRTTIHRVVDLIRVGPGWEQSAQREAARGWGFYGPDVCVLRASWLCV